MPDELEQYELHHRARIAKAIDLIIHKGRVGEVYNVGGHNEKQNIEIVKIICKELGNCYTDVSLWKPICFSKSMCTKGNVMAEHGNSR